MNCQWQWMLIACLLLMVYITNFPNYLFMRKMVGPKYQSGRRSQLRSSSSSIPLMRKWCTFCQQTWVVHKARVYRETSDAAALKRGMWYSRQIHQTIYYKELPQLGELFCLMTNHVDQQSHNHSKRRSFNKSVLSVGSIQHKHLI